MWWIGHVFLGLITGIICYIAWKDDNKKAAKKHLVWSLIIMIVVWSGMTVSAIITIYVCDDVIYNGELGTFEWEFCAGFLTEADYDILPICIEKVEYGMTEEEYADFLEYMDIGNRPDDPTDTDLFEYYNDMMSYPAFSECGYLWQY